MPSRAPIVMCKAEELVPGHGTLPKLPAQSAGDRLGGLFLRAAHHHAKVHRFDDYTDAARLEHSLDRLGDLLREPLLHLQPAGEDLDNTRQLRDADDLAVSGRWVWYAVISRDTSTSVDAAGSFPGLGSILIGGGRC